MQSIKEIPNKIKTSLEDSLKNNLIFTVLAVTLVAFCSFGLGRLSKTEENKGNFSFQNQVLNSNSVANISNVVGDSPQSVEPASPAGRVQAPQISSLATGGKYVGSKNSDKYHAPWCSGAQRIKEENQIWFNSKEEAESAGYSPASNCKGI